MTLQSIYKDKQKMAEWLVLLLMPAAGYMLFEFITGNLFSIGGKYVWLNLMFYYMFYLTLFAVTGSVRISYLFWNTVLPVLAAAEYFVVAFRARPIMVWDVMAFRTAMTVSGNYVYEFTGHLAGAVLIVLVLDVLVWKFGMKVTRKRLWKAAGGLGISAGILCIFFGLIAPSASLDISMWEPVESYGTMGYVLCTMRSLGYIKAEKPDGYTYQKVQAIDEEIEQKKNDMALFWKAGTDVVPTNIICIMNESFSDLSVIGDFETNIPYLSYYNSLDENCIQGNMFVPVFGSMTSNTEYEFLTGNSMAFAPQGSVPYQVYMGKHTYSLAHTLKAQGYRTVAMHPYPAENWNRTAAYKSMGFDEFLAEDYFEDAPRIRNYVSDMGDYDKIIELTKQKAEGEPLFIFNVTMQNHGGYESEYESQVHLTDLEDMPMTEQYLSLIRESDLALEHLIDYYSGIDEPTMIVMFGDHQPSVEEAFYEALYGAPLDSLKPEDYVRRYITPFMVWTNYETPSANVERLSTQYLSGIVLQRANLRMTDYLYFLEDMSRQVPVNHMMGYYNSDGVWESWTGWNKKKEYSLLNKFDMLQYNNIFDRKHQQGAVFGLSGSVEE